MQGHPNATARCDRVVRRLTDRATSRLRTRICARSTAPRLGERPNLVRLIRIALPARSRPAPQSLHVRDEDVVADDFASTPMRLGEIANAPKSSCSNGSFDAEQPVVATSRFPQGDLFLGEMFVPYRYFPLRKNRRRQSSAGCTRLRPPRGHAHTSARRESASSSRVSPPTLPRPRDRGRVGKHFANASRTRRDPSIHEDVSRDRRPLRHDQKFLDGRPADGVTAPAVQSRSPAEGKDNGATPGIGTAVSRMRPRRLGVRERDRRRHVAAIRGVPRAVDLRNLRRGRPDPIPRALIAGPTDRKIRSLRRRPLRQRLGVGSVLAPLGAATVVTIPHRISTSIVALPRLSEFPNQAPSIEGIANLRTLEASCRRENRGMRCRVGRSRLQRRIVGAPIEICKARAR